MARDYDDLYFPEEDETEPREVETCSLSEPGPCAICGKPGRDLGCFRCGRPVCYNESNYWESSTCGGWILDSWHPAHPDDNEFYCNVCLAAGLVPDSGVETAAGLTFKYAESQALLVTIDSVVHELSLDDTRTLVAYLYDERGELFGTPYDPDAVAESVPDLVPVPMADDLEGLDDHPF